MHYHYFFLLMHQCLVRILSFKSGGLRFNSWYGTKTFFFFLFSEALSLFVGFIVIFIVAFTNSTVFPTMNSTMDTLDTWFKGKNAIKKCVQNWYFGIVCTMPYGYGPSTCIPSTSNLYLGTLIYTACIIQGDLD